MASRSPEHLGSVPRSSSPLSALDWTRLGLSACLPLWLCSQRDTFCSCSERSSCSLGSLCPGGRGRECVAFMRGDCREAGCHGARGPGCTPRTPRFSGCVAITAARGARAKGERRGSLRQSSRRARRGHTAAQEGLSGHGPGTDRSLLVVFSWLRCYACVPGAGSEPTDSQACPRVSPGLAYTE